MQPKLLIDERIDEFNDIHKKFEDISVKFFQSIKLADKLDSFSKSESNLKKLHHIV